MPRSTRFLKVQYRASARLAAAFVALMLAGSGFAANAETRSSILDHGEYVARGSGCMSCHGEDLSGGYRVETPMGTIVASNISPSRKYGIGGYDRDAHAAVLRRGVLPISGFSSASAPG